MVIDSCVLIDLSRRVPAAIEFLGELENAGAKPAVSALSVTEIMPVDMPIALVGANYLRTYSASHNLDIVDALIAATSSSLGHPLATLNLKHFPMFPGLRRPY